MDLIADGDGRQDTRTEREIPATARDLMVNDRHAPGTGPQAREPLSPEPSIDQVVVGDIPVQAPGFRLRAGLLGELDRSGTQVSVIQAGTGRPGLGATQAAAAYARAKLDSGWRLVAWVNATDNSSLLAGLAAVADAVGLTDDEPGQGTIDAAASVRYWLEADGENCLLVFDDVSDPDTLRPLLPTQGAARVLVTSTWRSVADLGNAVAIDVFSAAEASAFLVGRTGLDDEAGAAAVAAELGYLPLALALAVPVITRQRHGYARYLDRLQTTPAEISLTGDDGQRFPYAVARAALLALAAIRPTDKTGMCTRVLAIMAVLSAAGVRRDLLHVAGRAGVLASGGRRIEAAVVDQALKWLSDRSLLTFSLDGQNVMMHPVVAQVVRHGLVRRQRLGAVCWVAASMLEAHAIGVAGSQDRQAIRRIPQQVSALLDNAAEVAEEVDEELAEILLRLRFISLYHLIELGDSASQAIVIGEPLIADLDRLLGPGHPDTLNAQNSLAAAYLAADRVADAIPLFEQTLAVLQHQLGPDHPDTLTSQNNLASAYQDGGRIGEAIQLYELNLASRERVLGADHPSAMTSRGNLATAYLADGRTTEAIPLLEQTLASRERVLGPDHPDTQTSRKNLAKAYQDAGRADEAIALLGPTSAGRPRSLRPASRPLPPVRQTPSAQARRGPADPAPQLLPADFRRPPADAARPALPAGFRRPPVDPAGRLPSDRVVPARARLSGHSSASLGQDTPVEDAEHDRAATGAIVAGDPAGMAMAYDRHAAALYGYCHWMLRDSAAAAESLQDTFVVAAVTLRDRSQPVKLRPWLFALARNECRRRGGPRSADGNDSSAENQPAKGDDRADEIERLTEAAGQLADSTMQFKAVSESAEATMQFPAAGRSADATMQFRAVRESAVAVPGPNDPTMQMSVIGAPADVIRGPSDSTMQFSVIGQPADATMQFRLVSERAEEPDGIADFNGYLGQAELRELIRSVLADMKPREREVVELSFRHDLHDNDLAIALGVSESRARVLTSRTRGRLEKSFGALRTALAGRQACPVVGELLADWDGQLSEQTRDLVAWHIEQCQTCRNHAQGALRPTVLSGLLPLTALPPDLRAKVLSRCSATSEDAVAYRRRVVRRAESTWAAFFAQAVRRASWDSIRTHPGAAIATTAVAVWVVAAVSVTLLTFAGPRSARAQVVQPTSLRGTHAAVAETSAGISASVPATAPTTARARTSAARPSPVVTQPVIYVSSQLPPSPSLRPSKSPKPSKSASPKPSKSSSPSGSPTSSPSASPSPTA